LYATYPEDFWADVARAAGGSVGVLAGRVGTCVPPSTSSWDAVGGGAAAGAELDVSNRPRISLIDCWRMSPFAWPGIALAPPGDVTEASSPIKSTKVDYTTNQYIRGIGKLEPYIFGWSYGSNGLVFADYLK
jgi:hypothetical protein